MEIYNYYINTANQDRDDKNYSFNFRLGNNINLKEDEKAYFKLVNFSMMNSMLNVSAFHKNNQFRINDGSTTTTYTITDGNYSVLTLRDKINELTVSTALAFNYDRTTNSYYINTSGSGFIFYPMNMKMILGFTKDSYNLIVGDTYAEKFANLLPYTKILITTNNLTFNPTTDNNLKQEYSSIEGINEIITWIDRDEPPFTTIKYENLTNDKYHIANKNFNYINFTIMNEFKEVIKDAPNCFIQFQIIISRDKSLNDDLEHRNDQVSSFLE